MINPNKNSPDLPEIDVATLREMTALPLKELEEPTVVTSELGLMGTEVAVLLPYQAFIKIHEFIWEAHQKAAELAKSFTEMLPYG